MTKGTALRFLRARLPQAWRQRKQRTRSALTLIEMVVALVLASMMMAGLLRIVSWISIETNQLRTVETDDVAAGYLVDRLRNDLINARGIAVDNRSIMLTGFVSPQLVPGVVTYETVLVNDQPVLLRRIGNLSEVCWVGFGGFIYEPYDDIDGETPRQDGSGNLPPIPTRFKIAAVDRQARLIFSEVVKHHAD